MGSVNRLWIFLMQIVLLAGCDGMMNDLNPSSSDKRVTVQSGTVGSNVGQLAPNFTLSDTLGTSVTLSSALTGTLVKGVVLYFTMWCSSCDIDMSSMRSVHIPFFTPAVRFYAVDSWTGSVADVWNSELSNGYAGSKFIVLADTDKSVLNLYHGDMGITVVIDNTGVVRMNEVYDANRLMSTLVNLP